MAKNSSEEFITSNNFEVVIGDHTWNDYETVSGIGIDFEDIAIQQGDKNQMLNRPGRYNANDIVLTRRLKKDRELFQLVKVLKDGDTKRKNGSIILKDLDGKEVLRYNFFGAWCKSWRVPALSKGQNAADVLLEEVVMSVNEVEMA
jgi:phage tail-like protein